jgi:hypothetical protein
VCGCSCRLEALGGSKGVLVAPEFLYPVLGVDDDHPGGVSGEALRLLDFVMKACGVKFYYS